MKQNKLNKHGQPFSKKQKKASRVMMSMRNGFKPRNSPSISNFKMESDSGMMASIAALMMRMKLKRKAS